jgi:branched-subunit amino acid ABC-type transport system permease component
MTTFGAAAVSLMAISYGLEPRDRRFTFLFAVACGLSSIYGFLIGSLPFGTIEALWSVLALHRLRGP